MNAYNNFKVPFSNCIRDSSNFSGFNRETLDKLQYRCEYGAMGHYIIRVSHREVTKKQRFACDNKIIIGLMTCTANRDAKTARGEESRGRNKADVRSKCGNSLRREESGGRETETEAVARNHGSPLAGFAFSEG